MIDPRDWSVSAALNGGDSTRMSRSDVDRCTHILVRTDTPLGQPVTWRRSRRERLVFALARVALNVYYAVALGAVLIGGGTVVRLAVDAAVRLLTGAR